ncbi:hypothetical protein D0907_20155 (plasmid) [Pseudoalteromonas lipolytica]|jgi:hypothetical protein|uniref:DUF2946 domain-containing protein n=1 Tax=Pseudoalteromonas lipolytica TaxID=570156 RepID=A0AAD0S5R2_9GAMM|nr:hypothetical protein D0907_20155 [Pseudoalteromonas donghaensis]MAB53558.1 hypothetical protein [Marinobacter sp.]
MLRSMTKVVRTFLMWIMLLALPVQGMAQASMFACHLNGDGPGSVQIMDHSNMDHRSMDHSMHEMDSHDHANSDDSKKLMKSLHGCCNCAPTCAVVLLPVAQASFGAIQHDTLHPLSAPQIPHSADTRRIDRPPKTLAI